MDKFKYSLQQIAKFWGQLSTPRRLALVGLSTLMIATVLLVSYFGSREHFSYIYTGLEPQDASAVVEKLKALQVPYKIEADGRTILVPDERIPGLRLELASAGLPKGGGVGFELFDKSQLGATEFEQHVNLKRALEGELTRSILTIDGVKSARVHLVIPERRLFVSQAETASASVVVKLQNPQAFGKKEVAGIVHLVSSAVPGLSRNRISVVSTDGVTLQRPDAEGESLATGGLEAQSEQSKVIATRLEQNVRSQLERVVGLGNAEVRVALDLDTSNREKVEEHYEPSKTALRSEQKSEERLGKGPAGVAGVPGAVTNLPDAQQPGAEATEAPTGGDAATVRLSQTRNWEVDKVSQKTTMPPGDIRRLSVSVLLNDREERKNGRWVSTPRTSQEVAKLEDLVKRAVGFNLERGDSVQVVAAPFARIDTADEELKVVTGWRKWLPLALGAVAGLAALAVLVLVWRKNKKRQKALEHGHRRGLHLGAIPVRFGPDGQPLSLSESEAAAALEAGTSNPALPESQKLDGPALRLRALQIAGEDPATAAIVIRRWLNAATGAAVPART